MTLVELQNKLDEVIKNELCGAKMDGCADSE